VLFDAFHHVTGRDNQPFTMGGGTYARKFANAASFGAEMPWDMETYPSWVGGMHAANEGVRIDSLKQMFHIYACAIYRLSLM